MTSSSCSTLIKRSRHVKKCLSLVLFGTLIVAYYNISETRPKNDGNNASMSFTSLQQKAVDVGSSAFKWLKHEEYDKTELTASTSESVVETAVFTYMKQLQITCPNKIRMGREEDGGWYVCDAGPFRIVKPCLVYSIGMGGEWSFDEMITTKYGCQDMAYDPSIGKPDHRPNPLLWFFNTGLGAADEINSQKWRIRTFPTLLKENNHTKATIDILKMDIEYSEWSSLQAMLNKPSCLDNVKQLMIEFHTREMTSGAHSSKEDLLSYWNVAKGLDKLGFKLWTYWDNAFCDFDSKRSPGLKLCGCFNAYFVNTKLL